MRSKKKSLAAKQKIARRHQRLVNQAVALCGSQTALAIRGKGAFTKQQVSHWVTGRYPVSPACAIKIESATGGDVSREQFHPELYKGFVRVEQQQAA